MKCSPGISNFLEEITSLSHSIDFLYFFALRAGFILGGSKIIADGDCSHEIKRCLLLHAKMGSIKDRNGMDLTEAEDIKKSWREYTEELYKKDLHNPDNHDGMITHLEPESWNVKSSGLRKYHYEQS